jgi:hypothetical protein
MLMFLKSLTGLTLCFGVYLLNGFIFTNERTVCEVMFRLVG